MDHIFKIQIQRKDKYELNTFKTVQQITLADGKIVLYLVTDKIPVFVTVNLSVLLKHTVLDTGTHEVEIALAGCKTATHSGS